MLIRLFASLTLVLALYVSAMPGTGPADAAERRSIAVATPNGHHVFSVEVAGTSEERARGLMFRKKLSPNAGMLFDFGHDREVTMWMQNTYIPLDMIFISADGRITRIAENNKPRSTTLISSGGAVRAVLEVRAGTARKLGITAGNMVEHLPFKDGVDASKR
jgi:uncharacterized membrane protein (UPF0127 family)